MTIHQETPRKRGRGRPSKVAAPPLPPEKPRSAKKPAASVEGDQFYLSLQGVERMTSLYKSTIYEMIRKGKFPPSLALHDRRVGWERAAVVEWCEARKSVALRLADERSLAQP
jgi:predicted DNA-binding transcriptional regulator AlpA